MPDPIWPTPSFMFVADFGAYYGQIYFQEISGLNLEGDLSSSQDGPMAIPNAMQSSNVTLRKGKGDSDKILASFSKDLSQVITTLPVEIKLLDQSGSPLMRWTLHNAYPVKWQYNQEEGQLLIEELKLTCSGITQNTLS